MDFHRCSSLQALKRLGVNATALVAQWEKSRSSDDLDHLIARHLQVPEELILDEITRGLEEVLSADPAEKPHWVVRAAKLAEWLEKCVREVENLLIVAELHELGFSLDPKSVYFWLCYLAQDRLEEVLKFKTALHLAVALKQTELPPDIPLLQGDRSQYLCGGGVGRRIHRRIYSQRPNVKLALDLYHRKRGALPVSDTFVNRALHKHWNTITEEIPEGSPAEEEVLEHLADEVRETVREVFGPRKRGWKSFPAPSYGACFENSRSKGGSYGLLIDQWKENRNYIVGGNVDYLVGFLHCNHRVAELRSGQDPELFLEFLEDYEQSLYRWSGGTGALDDRVHCVPVPLLEPYKVRVITRGSAAPYQLCRQWQRKIAYVLGTHPTFRLTRGPQDPSDIADLLRKADGKETGFWVSGDYSSATDKLHPYLSEVCLEEICRLYGIPWRDRLILLKCLTRHNVVNSHATGLEKDDELDYDDRPVDANWGQYPRDSLEDSSKPQARGQMMGSPISFPILCLVNAAVTRFALRSFRVVRNKSSFRLENLPILINGDDVLFHCEREADYVWWKEVTRIAGLEFSLGKNYSSKEHLMINSELFQVSREVDFWGQGCYRLKQTIPHLNLGLLYGEQKSVAAWNLEETLFGTHWQQQDSIRCRHNNFLLGFPGREETLSALFIGKNRGEAGKPGFLRYLPGEVCYWICPELGGLGFTPPSESCWNKTEKQRKMAAYLWNSPGPDVIKAFGPLILERSPSPGWSEQCFNAQTAAMKELEVRYQWSPRSETAEDLFPRLSKYWMLLGTGTPRNEDPSENWRIYQRRVRRFWRLAQATGLAPLSRDKCVIGPGRVPSAVLPVEWEKAH